MGAAGGQTIQAKGIIIPDKLDTKHQALVDKLSKLSDAEFNKSYVAEMVKGHKATDAPFTKEAKSGQDANIKAFAAKTDETVKMHLSMIERHPIEDEITL